MSALSAALPYTLLCLAWGAYELLISHRRRAADGGIHDQGTLKLLWRVLYGAIVLGVAAAYARVWTFPPAWQEPMRWLGCALIAGGLGFRLWAIRVLDRWFTVDVTIQRDQQLVERGPYRRLCHPSYTGALLAFCGLALGMGNGLSVLVILPAAVWAFIRRIKVEEAALRQAFGPRYAAYVRARWRLLPGIW